MICEDLLTTTITGDAYDPPETLPFDELQSNPPPFSMSWGNVTDALLGIRELEDDWDGMGAGRIDRVVIERCFECAQQLREDGWAPPHIVRPSPDGGVCFEWQDDDIRLELEVSEDTAEFFDFPA